MAALKPRWKIAFPASSSGGDAQFFDPVIVDQRGVLITGNSAAVSVLLISDRPGVWYTVKARVAIYGFSATPGALYVQDGPVLSGWALTEHRCFAAVNLVTEQRWAPDPDEEAQIEPPESLYDLPPETAKLQGDLLTARSRHLQPEASGGSVSAPDSEWLKEVPGAERLVFSAPAVREIQFEGGSGRIFSLCMDGVAIALTEELEVAGKRRNEIAPLRAELAMAEVEQRGGEVLCWLYYIGTDGSIVALDATTDLKLLPSRWASKGAPAAAKVLPLRYQDGLLFGGGILGADFFVLELDPSRPPQCTVAAPPGGWKRYEIAAADKLVILTDGASSRLIAYGKEVKQRDRWGQRSPAVESHAVFWTGTGRAASPPSTPLTLEVDKARASGAADIGFRVVLANTVDTEIEPRFTPQYPPPACTLYANALEGPAAEPAPVTAILCKPVVMRNVLYCVARFANPAKDMLLAYSIAPIQAQVAAQAAAELQKNTAEAKPIWLQINYIEDYEVGQGERRERAGRHPERAYANRDVLVIVEPPGVSYQAPQGERVVRTNARGQLPIETSMAGYGIRVSENFRKSIMFCESVGEIVGKHLERQGLNFIRFTGFIRN